MNIRDRVKQTATLVGTDGLTYNLAGGTAPEGFRTFAEAYQTFSAFASSGAKNYEDLIVLIERANGEWQINIGTMTANKDDSTITITGIKYASTENIASFPDNWVDGEEVTISLAMGTATWAGMDVAKLDFLDGYGPTWELDGVFFPKVSNGGALAVGMGAKATADDAVAIGNSAQANGIGTYALGKYQILNGKGAMSLIQAHSTSLNYFFATGGGGARNNFHNAHYIGLGSIPKFSGAAAQTIGFERSILNGQTTDATPTNLGQDLDGTSIGEEILCENGITVFEGDVTAYQLVASGVGGYKVWHVKFAVYTDVDYIATQIIGTTEVTELAASASAASWGVAPVLVSATNNTVAVQVTGAAATNISWAYHFMAKSHYLW